MKGEGAGVELVRRGVGLVTLIGKHSHLSRRR